MTQGVDLAPRVRSLLAKVIDLELVSDDVDLLESGRIDSLALVELIFAIEEEFGVELALEQLDPEHFRTVDAIVRLVVGAGAPVTQNGVPAQERAIDP